MAMPSDRGARARFPKISHAEAARRNGLSARG